MRTEICLLFMILINSFCITDLISQPDVQIQGDTVIYTYQLEEVVVYGDRSRKNSAQNIEIDQKELQAKQSLNIAEVLADNSAITVTTGAKGESSTKIRGFSSKDILVLVDGRPINPGTYGKVDLAMLPTDNVARIKVIKGPASVAYGPNATGGVINIITKNGQEKPQTRIHAEIGDYNFRRLQINHSSQYKKFNYWIAAYEHHRDGYELSSDFKPTSLEDGAKRENSNYQKWGLNSKVGWQKSPKTLYSVSMGYHEAEKNVPYGVYRYLDNRYFRFPEWLRYHAAADGFWILTEKFDLRGNLAYDSYQDRLISYTNASFNENSISFNSKLENFTYSTAWTGTYKPGNAHVFSFGLNSTEFVLEKKPDLDQKWIEHHTNTSSLYLEDMYQPADGTSFRMGIGSNLFSQGNKTLRNYFAFSILADHKILSKIMLNAGLSKMQRFPTLNSLYSQDYGNPDLKPEDGIKYEMGVSGKFSVPGFPINTTLSGSIFYNDLKNKIDKQKTDSVFTQYVNVHTAKIGGFELVSNWKFNNILSGKLGYSYLEAYDYGEEMLFDVPQNKLNGQVQVQWKNISLLYIFSWNDNRSTFYNRQLPSYNLHTININYSPFSNLEFQIKIQNLLDTYYEEEIGYPAPGRMIIGGFSYTI